MDKKGGAGNTFWVVIVILLAVAVAVWFFAFVYPNLVYGATGLRSKTEDLFKSFDLRDLSKGEIEEAREKTPDLYMNKLFEDAENNFILHDKEKLAESKILFELYLKESEDPNLKKFSKASYIKKAQDRLKEIEEKEILFKEVGESSDDWNKIIELETIEEKIKAYEEFIKKYSDSDHADTIDKLKAAEAYLDILKEEVKKPITYHNYYYNVLDIIKKIKIGLGDDTYDRLINDLEELSEKLGREYSINVDSKNLRGEIKYWIMTCYNLKRNKDKCDKIFLSFKDILRYDKDSVFVVFHGSYGKSIAEDSFAITYYCAKGFDDYELIEKIFDLYMSSYRIQKYTELDKLYLNKYLDLAKNIADPYVCSVETDRKNCINPTNKFIWYNNEKIEYIITESLIKMRPELACYWKSTWGKIDCFNCDESTKDNCIIQLKEYS